MRRPSRKQVREVLSESIIDPRSPGRHQLLIDDDAPWAYYVGRAREFMREAEASDSVTSDKRLRDAITVLSYARCLLQQRIGSDDVLRRKPTEGIKRGPQASQGA